MALYLRKTRIKGHTRRTTSGKVVRVKDHERKGRPAAESGPAEEFQPTSYQGAVNTLSYILGYHVKEEKKGAKHYLGKWATAVFSKNQPSFIARLSQSTKHRVEEAIHLLERANVATSEDQRDRQIRLQALLEAHQFIERLQDQFVATPFDDYVENIGFGEAIAQIDNLINRANSPRHVVLAGQKSGAWAPF